MDVVYTWVDGAWPGYDADLRAYATVPVDRNPNRYRDNLDLLKYSLRSLESHLEEADRVFLVTRKPQVPSWLDTERVRVVHHDACVDTSGTEPPVATPTFSSFAIVSMLHRVPGVGREFLYMEDDRLFLRPTRRSDFVDARGRLRLHVHGERTPSTDPGHRSPWERALYEANVALDARYGACERPSLKRAPLFVDRDAFATCVDTFRQEIGRTRANRFRSPGSVPLEHLYPWAMYHQGRGVLADPGRRVFTRSRRFGYAGLVNVAWWNAASIAFARARGASMLTLNDDFGASPRTRAVNHVRRFLDRTFPRPSRFERPS